jgi:transcriptional regulator GlxA family with amidase domain
LIRICQQVGIPARCLQISFLKSFGISMKAYAHALRFNGVRRDLIAACPAEQSVKAIARHWGFCHMGRFSINYRRWFGECPVQTLKRLNGVKIG